MPDAPEKKSLKSTLNLPETAFPMKANLPENEPARLAAWQAAGLYEEIRRARAGAPKYILHDGPPYANGAIHLGHALNKCIKDFVVKTKTMAGFDSPYVPGWDCHGLPIEIKVDEKLGRKKLDMPPVSVRRACREYAAKFVDLQRSQFERLGILGRWHDPYLTMSFGYEAAVLETFYRFFEGGFVYKGLKPVFWCIHDQTALAEAEVEYETHISPSVYVRYHLTSDPARLSPTLAGQHVDVVIWTTTPWTLPASQAVAFHPELIYVALQTSEAIYLLAEQLVPQVVAACSLKPVTGDTFTERDILARFPGAALDGSTFQHPFLDRQILGVTAPYVTADQGTGAVHTAPAHGVDDFYTGKRYSLPDLQYVDNAGRQRNTESTQGTTDPAVYADLTVFESNQPIIDLLRERGALLAASAFEHSYPHCWRCHNPVIVRATEQWFISMETLMPGPNSSTPGDTTTFRQRALDAIKQVSWDPAWGQERISNMIATRPDWCISRQRIWGVPIAVFLCNRCHEPLNNPAVNAQIVDLFRAESADAWYTKSAEDLLPPHIVCAKCGARDFRREMDILDVWFESGASWHAVLEPEGNFPADLYTEGGDQHRGWFHSSLLTSVALRGEAPYRTVATSGWTLDEQGRAFSKSLGNGVDPVDVAKRLGAEIIRLWVASVDFREDVAASDNLMARVGDNYRKLRNTLRFLLSNLYDFNPAENAIPFAAMEPIDQYILTRLRTLVETICGTANPSTPGTFTGGLYEKREFHRAYQALNEFVNTDLSALYLDVLKDRLYTFAPNAPARRSGQTALWRIAEALTRLIAPILSFTADEVWSHLPKLENREPSVHLTLFPDLSDIVPSSDHDFASDWEFLLALREKVNSSLERSRARKEIGKALEATVSSPSLDTTVSVAVAANYQQLAAIKRYTSALPELLNVSVVNLDLQPGNLASETFTFGFGVSPSSDPKCERCWRYVPDVAANPDYPTVCLRCAEALEAIHFAPYSLVTT